MGHTHAFRKWLGSRRAVAAAVTPLIALAGLMTVATAAQAVTVSLGTVQGQMSDHAPTSGNCIRYSPTGTSTSSGWVSSPNVARTAHGSDGSCPTNLTTSEQSVIGVYPTSTTSVNTGAPFLLGQMEHINNPVQVADRYYTGKLSVQLAGLTIPFPWNMDETPNTGTADQNRDRITFSSQISDQTITSGGLTYKLVVLGFTNNGSYSLTNNTVPTCPVTPGDRPIVTDFLTYESQKTYGCLYAQLTQVRTLEIKKTAEAPYGSPASIPAFSYTPTSSLAGSPWSAGTANNFNLTPTAIGVGGTATLTPARQILATGETVTVTEGVPPTDWALTGLTCSDIAGPVTGVSYNLATRTVTLANVPEVTTAAQSKITCTFTNTYTARGALTLVKDVDNTGGGTAVPANWDLTATPSGDNSAGRTGFTGAGNTAAVTSQSVIAGEYTLSELGNNPVTDDYVQDGAWVCTGTGVTQDAVNPEIITVTRGAVATCTVTNAFTYGTLSLVKDVVNGYGTPAAATNWILTATPGTGAGVVDPTDDLTEPGGFDPVAVYAGAYSLSETGSVAGYTNGDIWSCLGGTLDSATDTVTVTAGADVVCTITNTADAPTLTLVKQVDNTAAGSLGAGVGDWTLSAINGEENISGVSGAEAVTSAQVNEGTYALAEVGDTDATAGYDWTDLTCVQADGTPEGTPIDGVDVDTPNVTLAVGDDVTCTFTNTAQPGSVTWTKVHVGTTDPLADSVWSLTGPGHPAPGTEVTDCVAETCTGLDKDPDAGEFLLEDLTWGDYSLVETSAPPGYIVDDTEHPFQVNADNVSQIVIGPFENVPVTPPTIPLTGGISRDFYTLAGLFVLTLGVGGMGARRFVGRKEAALTP